MRLFVTATDTDVGKTWATCHLIEYLQQQGKNYLALKPVVSGYQPKDQHGDVQTLLAAQHLSEPDDINRYRFAQASAPSIAAACEQQTIDMPELLHWCDNKLTGIDYGIIEGVGGLMVPLNDDATVLDWMTQLSLTHILLCVPWKLGCINHALLSVAALQSRGLTPNWLLLNAQEPMQDSNHAAAMYETIRLHLPKKTRILQTTAHNSTALAGILSEEFKS